MRHRHALSKAAAGPQNALESGDFIRISGVVITALAMALIASSLGYADDTGEPADDPLVTDQHFSIENPQQVSDEEAERIYRDLLETMVDGYALSDVAIARDYPNWDRYSRVPYRSRAHGNRFVNNYANAIARDYGRYEQAGRMPEGSILVKDNITVTGEGVITPGALLIMEKMPTGFNAASGDWRYTMIMPDGSLFGTTNGQGSARVEFCNTCHKAAERHDYMFFLPRDYRR